MMTTVLTERTVVSVRAERLRLLAASLDRPVPAVENNASPVRLGRALVATLDVRDRSQVWLAMAVMTGHIPTDEEVQELAREAEFDDGAALGRWVTNRLTPDNLAYDVRVPPQGTVLLDVTATNVGLGMSEHAPLARELHERWARRGALAVSWVPGLAGLVPLDRLPEPGSARAVTDEVFVVPWRCTFVVPDAYSDRGRADRTRSLARFAQVSALGVVHGCNPMTMAEAESETHPTEFAHYLSALAHFRGIAATSRSVADEFAGWKEALAATGVTGPDIQVVRLPDEVPSIPDDVRQWAVDLLDAGDSPVVLVPDVPEPIRNGLAVLHAAELLWRRGLRFKLVFLGGRMKDFPPFAEQVDWVRGRGRDIDLLPALAPLEVLALKSVARFGVCPAVADASGRAVGAFLAVGTPVVVSDFGSVREVAGDGGALFVDPRDDESLAAAMGDLLGGETLVESLRRAAEARQIRTWDAWADDIHTLLG